MLYNVSAMCCFITHIFSIVYEHLGHFQQAQSLFELMLTFVRQILQLPDLYLKPGHFSIVN
jgi:hypothetical protein